jgi:hypothetical protein
MTKRLNAGLRRVAIDELRELCAWYEWSEPPDLAAASVLQAASDAVSASALSVEAADALIAVWQPFVGLEAHAGNRPPIYTVATSDEELQRAIVADLRSLIGHETSSAKCVHLARLMEKQIQSFLRGAP